MKKQEKEKLHEDDGFVKFAKSVWGAVSARQAAAKIVLAVIVGLLVAVAVVSATREEMTDAELSAVDGAETIDQMVKVAKRYPKAVDLQLRLGTACVRRGEKGDMELAEAAFERAVGSARNSLEECLAGLALGKVKMDLRKYEQALQFFEKAAGVTEVSSLIGDEATWYAGRCCELLGKPEEAGRRYDRIRMYSGRNRGGTWESLAEYRQTKMRQESLE